MKAETCSKCHGTGWSPVEREGVRGVARCDCLRVSRVDRLMVQASIPKRYQHCELNNFDLIQSKASAGMPMELPADLEQKFNNPRSPDPRRSADPSIQRAKTAAEKFVQEYPMPQPFGLLFMGPQGIGKTHLAVGIIKELIRRKSVPALFCTFPELLKEIQNSYNPVSQASEMALLMPVLETEVLVLDELGAQKPSDWVRDQVAYILNYRYNENKVTIITTNYQDREESDGGRSSIVDSLEQRISERIRSRLFEMCKTIKMTDRDYRKEIKQAEHHF